jgi:HK97 family phage portal protein
MGLKQFVKNIRHLGSARLDEVESRSSQVFSLLNGDLAQYLNNIATSNVDYGLLGAATPQAMRIATVFTCVLVRAESFSTLPINVMQSTPDGAIVAYNHPAYNLIHNKPNPFQTASSFWKSVCAHIDLYGNAYAKIRYSGRFQPTRIDLIEDPTCVEIRESESGKAIYKYKGTDYQDYEILHFKDLSLDGFYGCSRIKFNAETIGYARKLKTYGNNAIGTKPPGYFSTDATFDTVKKQEDALSKTWKEKIASGDAPVLPFGVKYNNLQITPGDAQYLEAVGATK